MSSAYEILLRVIERRREGLRRRRPGASARCVFSIISICWVDSCGTSAFPCTIPPIRDDDVAWEYDAVETPSAVSTFRSRIWMVLPILSITAWETPNFEAKTDVSSGHIRSKWPVMSFWNVPTVDFCIRAHSKVRSFIIAASTADRWGRNPC